MNPPGLEKLFWHDLVTLTGRGLAFGDSCAAAASESAMTRPGTGEASSINFMVHAFWLVLQAGHWTWHGTAQCEF